MRFLFLSCHSRESGNPVKSLWIPAFAGMTVYGYKFILLQILNLFLLGLLLTNSLAVKADDSSFDFTTSDERHQWQIRIIAGNAEHTKTGEKHKRPRIKPEGYRYWGSIYPLLLIPGKYPVIWYVYYRVIGPDGSEVLNNPGSALELWGKIRAWREAEQRLARIKLTNSTSPAKDTSVDASLKAEQLDKLLQKGLQLFKENKIDEAKQMFKEGILLDTGSGIAHILYGHSLFASGDYALATKALRRGLRLNNDLVSSQMDLKEFYGQPGILTQQTAKLETWIKYHPQNLETMFLLGYIYFFTGQLDKAIDSLKTVCGQNPLDNESDLLLKKSQELNNKK